MLDNYLNILQESLKKKIRALAQIKELSDLQAELLKNEEIDMEAFDRTVDEKDIYVKELNKLDEGFETLYDNIKKELLENKDRHAEQIGQLKQLIAEITDRSASIQAQEDRNKAMLESYFSRQRQNLGQVRKSTKAAYGYYQNMGKPMNPGGSFLDKKK